MHIASLFLVAATLGTADPRDARELLGQMRQRGSYQTLTFVQTTKLPGRPDQTWYESLMPGKLRIDFGPVDSQRVAIFRNDSIYSFRGGRMVRSGPYVHGLMVLLGDVYHLAPESSMARLSREGFDLSKLHEDRFLGRRVWVVGAERGDTTTPQFWIDAERLHMVRLIERNQGQQGGTNDAHVLRLEQHSGVWLEAELVFYTNGREMQREIYNQVRINPPLDPVIFEPDQYRKPSWIP